MNISNVQCFLLDLDGTIYLGDHIIDGSLEALKKIKESGKIYRFLTNNSSTSIASYQKHLKKFGIKAQKGEIISSNLVAIKYLNDNFHGKKIYVMASKEVIREYKKAGVLVVEDNPDAVVLTFDKTLTYKKLEKACRFIEHGAFYIATHPDFNCPGENCKLPDVGSLMECIYKTNDKVPNIICGKPDELMAEYIKIACNLPSDKIAMIGDRTYTDMKFAQKAGFRSILVLSGETKKDMITEKYDLVLKSLKDLIKMFEN